MHAVGTICCSLCMVIIKVRKPLSCCSLHTILSGGANLCLFQFAMQVTGEAVVLQMEPRAPARKFGIGGWTQCMSHWAMKVSCMNGKSAAVGLNGVIHVKVQSAGFCRRRNNWFRRSLPLQLSCSRWPWQWLWNPLNHHYWCHRCHSTASAWLSGLEKAVNICPGNILHHQ